MKIKILILILTGTLLSMILASMRYVSAQAFYVDNSTRKGSYDAYTYLKNVTLATPLGWSGSVSGCVWGAPSDASKNATLETINYYRSLIKLQPVTFNPDYSLRAQQAAFMMYANNKITHYPTSDWKCYTEDGKNAAGSSNLYFGQNGPQTIIGYVSDGGVPSLGHRRWIIRGNVAEMGTGDTVNTNALYVLTPYVKRDNTPTFAPWPAPGYIPNRIIPGDWSFSTTDPTIDLTNAQVAILLDGAPIATTTTYMTVGYGDNGIKWSVPPSSYTENYPDRTYDITVSGMKQRASDGTLSPYPNYNYSVTVFDHRYSSPHIAGLLTMFRFYNMYTGTHFYTSSESEAATVRTTLYKIYRSEGMSGKVYPQDRPSGIGDTSLVNVHRFYNLRTGTHFYTSSEHEATNVINTMSGIYRYEGIAYKAEANHSSTDGVATLAVHRFYNFKNGTHFYTSSQAEATNVNNTMYTTYKYEGIAYYQYPVAQ